MEMGDGVMTIIFEDDFETGDFSKWTSTQTGTGDSCSVVSTDPHHGSKHAKFTTNGVMTEFASATKNIGGSYTIIYERGYFKFKDSLPPIDDAYEIPSQLKYLGNDVVNLYLQKTAGQVKLRLKLYRVGGEDEAWGTTVIALDTWYCIEVYVKVNDAVNGEAKCWLNGNLEISITGKDTTNTPNVNYCHVGNCYQNYAYAHSGYVDCVKIADAYIGTEVLVTMGKFQYATEPPSTGWNALKFENEPPVAGWNKLLYEGE